MKLTRILIIIFIFSSNVFANNYDNIETDKSVIIGNSNTIQSGEQNKILIEDSENQVNIVGDDQNNSNNYSNIKSNGNVIIGDNNSSIDGNRNKLEKSQSGNIGNIVGLSNGGFYVLFIIFGIIIVYGLYISLQKKNNKKNKNR